MYTVQDHPPPPSEFLLLPPLDGLYKANVRHQELLQPGDSRRSRNRHNSPFLVRWRENDDVSFLPRWWERFFFLSLSRTKNCFFPLLRKKNWKKKTQNSTLQTQETGTSSNITSSEARNESGLRENVLERVTLFDTSVSYTPSPLPSPLDTTFPRPT